MIGMVLGGAAAGWGGAQLEKLKAERDQRFIERGWDREDRRTKENQEFQLRRDDTERKFQTERDERQNKFTSEENAKTRASGADILTTEEGDSVVREGDRVKPLIGEDGKPVKLAGGTKDKPADVGTAEWLIQQGVAKDAKEAWSLVRQSKSNPEGSKQALFKAWMEILKPSTGNADAEEIQRQAQEMTDKTLRYLSEENADAAPESSEVQSGEGMVRTGKVEEEEDGGSALGSVARAAARSIPGAGLVNAGLEAMLGGETGEEEQRVVSPKGDGGEVPLAPSPEKRVFGRIYRNKAGKQARWVKTKDGSGAWEIVDGASDRR